ncbi:VOC family protein [Patescibacteria group bacterium]|nr:VOC family protein [Patescibacteria group bacterium]MBV1757978.1 VOC family protein [Dethiosulfatibacter sp.]
MAKVIGLGGIFVHFNGDIKDIFDWYEQNLGLSFSAYGSGFIEGEQLMVISFKRGDNSNSPYLNFRVDDLEEMIHCLKKQNIEIIDDIKEYEYGKFATIKDPFDNVLELWQAYSDPYKKMVEKELDDYKNSREPRM